jgi:hypothetical protein
MSKVTEVLATIDAPPCNGKAGFHCGIVLWDGVVIEAAPIVHKMKRQRWTRDRVRDYCRERGWKVSVVYEVERERP